MARGFKTGGRKKGGLNKRTIEIKAAIGEAFEHLGGVNSLVEWAKRNQTEFYRLWIKLLPTEIRADVNQVESPRNQVVVYIPHNGRDPLHLLQPNCGAAEPPDVQFDIGSVHPVERRSSI